MSGIGAGIDSYYEYLLKSYILFGEREDLEMFKEMYHSIMKYLRKGWAVNRIQQVFFFKGDITVMSMIFISWYREKSFDIFFPI